ncbi:MAG: 3-oxoacyl-[acyl-carrier-protein] reductase [Oscillospiraceae bacterium]|nr:3-oxoacyl-[acyl-carrier-protein] reductase [Oscillospiraceae bacterium]
MLKGKTAVVTGGSRGIGRAVTLGAAKNGANVAIVYSGDDAAAADVKNLAIEMGVKAEAYKCNVSDFEQARETCNRITTEFKAVDILVNNAGIARDKLLMMMSETDFDDVIDVNLKGAFNFIKHLSRAIIKSSAGRIINISSVSGLMGNAGQANYAAAKSGLIGLTKTVAKEFAGKKITCNAIAPGFIETDMTAGLPQSVRDHAGTAIPLKRMGTPDEVANAAIFLASDLASYITGEVLKVDGGLYI